MFAVEKRKNIRIKWANSFCCQRQKKWFPCWPSRYWEEELFLVKNHLHFRFQITAILTNCNFGCQKKLIDGAKIRLKKLRRKCCRMFDFAVHETLLVWINFINLSCLILTTVIQNTDVIVSKRIQCNFNLYRFAFVHMFGDNLRQNISQLLEKFL